MTQISIGDLAQSYLLRNHNTQLKRQMNTLSQELASGRTADVASHLNGDYSHLGEVERGLRVIEGYHISTTEAQQFTGSMQNALGHVQDISSDLANALIATNQGNLDTAIEAASTAAESDFEAMVATLNGSLAGRSLFAGAASDRSALASDMLDQIRLAVAGAGAVTTADVITAVTDWFDTPGGGFETGGYTGSTTGMSPFGMGDGQSVDLDLRADNQSIRDTLKNAAIAAIASDDSLGFTVAEKKTLLLSAGEGLLTTQDALTGIRADLGYAEERIEENATRIAAERTSLEYARGELLGVDQYETATRLEDVQFQLESLYTITVRLSRLSLMEFMS